MLPGESGGEKGIGGRVGRSAISRGVDCQTIREPAGVVVGILPFNLPALIPLLMMSVAMACGNTFLLEPAEKVPLTGTRLVELFADAGLASGGVGMVLGSKEVSERFITNPPIIYGSLLYYCFSIRFTSERVHFARSKPGWASTSIPPC